MQSSYTLENLGDLKLHGLQRIVFPELVAKDLVGVQPVSAPIGLAAALRFLYPPKKPEKLNMDWSLVNGKQ